MRDFTTNVYKRYGRGYPGCRGGSFHSVERLGAKWKPDPSRRLQNTRRRTESRRDFADRYRQDDENEPCKTSGAQLEPANNSYMRPGPSPEHSARLPHSLDALDFGQQRFVHHVIECIHDLRSIEGDGRNPSLHLRKHLGSDVAHVDSLLSLGCSCANFSICSFVRPGVRSLWSRKRRVRTLMTPMAAAGLACMMSSN